jgi:hypothetical protein
MLNPYMEANKRIIKSGLQEACNLVRLQEGGLLIYSFTSSYVIFHKEFEKTYDNTYNQMKNMNNN